MSGEDRLLKGEKVRKQTQLTKVMKEGMIVSGNNFFSNFGDIRMLKCRQKVKSESLKTQGGSTMLAF